jgi:hypothetical protein
VKGSGESTSFFSEFLKSANEQQFDQSSDNLPTLILLLRCLRMPSIRKTKVFVSTANVEVPAAIGSKVTKPKPTAVSAADSTFRATGAIEKPATLKSIDSKMKAAGVAIEIRNKIALALKTVAPSDFGSESALIEKALLGPNADRAMAAYERIQAVSASNSQAAQRLTPEIRGALVLGVSLRRTADSVGQEGILGVKQAEEAAVSLATMSKENYQSARMLLGASAVGRVSAKADAMAEKAVILKAIASRSDRLRTTTVDSTVVDLGLARHTEAERCMGEISQFAKEIHGLPRDELIRTTSPIDIESANTSNISPDKLSTPGTDIQSDNDGLYQRFVSTCGPTTAQMTRGEADPIFSRALHKEGLQNASTETQTAKTQRQTLNAPRFFDAAENEVIPSADEMVRFRATNTLPPGATQVEVGDSVSRRAEQAFAVAKTALETLSGVSEDDKSTTLSWLSGRDLMTPEKAAAKKTLTQLRAANGKSPSDAEVKLMQSEFQHFEKGMRLQPALREITTGGTHIEYQAYSVGRFGLNAAEVDEMEKRLKNGQDVPIRVDNHFMLTSDVRGKRPTRTVLVSDPMSGQRGFNNQLG